ncbi:MAG: glycosyltransferase family 4 protein [Chloroflexi bacterium]|nr:glycosyltransferase family 4 protein [Chloroflexota bacterium]
MQIGLVIYGELSTVSGGYLYNRQLVQQAEAQGHTVHLVSLPWRNYARHLGDNLSKPFFEQLRTLPVDVLIQDELNHPSLLWVNRRLRGQISYPIVSLVHHLRSSEAHSILLKSFYRGLERQYLRTVDGFIYNSQTTRISVEALLEKPQPAIVAYPAANHLPIPDPASLQKMILERTSGTEPLRILFIGNIIGRKNLHTLLAALAKLPKSTWQLTAVGNLASDPSYTARIRRQIKATHLSDVVHLTDALSEPALLEQLKKSHLLALPSYEGFGIVYLEAMSYGLPVIASTAGAAHEIVTHGQEGFLVAPGNIAGITQYIQTLQQNRDQLRAMSQAARARFARQPTWQTNATNILHWLREVKQVVYK